MKMKEIIGTIGILKFSILMVASTLWVMVQHMPYVPLGLLLIVYFVGKQELKVYVPFVLMSIIGFIGTGIYLNTYTTTRTMIATGKTFDSSHFKVGYRFGTSTMDYLLRDDSIVIYNDGKHSEEVKMAQAYVEKLEQSIHENNLTFMVESFVYQNGITKEQIKLNFEEMQQDKWLSKGSSYMGYLYWVYPKDLNHTEISLFYKVEFEKDSEKYTTLMYRVLLDEKIKLTQIGAFKENRKFRIVK
jgi:hypothetical protein